MNRITHPGLRCRPIAMPTRRHFCLAVGACLGASPVLAAAARLDTGVSTPWSLQPLGDEAWLVRAASGDADARNRGWVANLLIALDGARDGWLIGSGPTPAAGRVLAQALGQRWPQREWVAVSPWPQPEAVLGVAGLEPARHLAHREVAAQMAQRCPSCVARLRERLGASAVDLGEGDPVHLPQPAFDGEQGRLGPFSWWRLPRAEDVTVTVWLHRASGIAFAPGLLWGRQAPDGRSADIAHLAEATRRLAQPSGLPGWPDASQNIRWLGSQGGLQPATAPAAVAGYWQALQDAVASGVQGGELGLTVPAVLPGVDAAFTAHPWHALNWQRAWRQAESRELQRSLR